MGLDLVNEMRKGDGVSTTSVVSKYMGEMIPYFSFGFVFLFYSAEYREHLLNLFLSNGVLDIGGGSGP